MQIIGMSGTFRRFWPSKLMMIHAEKRHVEIQKYVKRICLDLICFDNIVTLNPNENRNIWIFWWQGCESAPETVRFSYQHLQSRHGKNFKVNFLDQQNFREFCDISEEILKLRISGDLHLAHFSDILRFSIIHAQGGIWMDAGMYADKNLDEFMELTRASLRKDPSMNGEKSVYVSRGRWSPAFLRGVKGDPFFECIAKCLARVHLHMGPAVEHLIMDDVLDVVISENPFLAEDLAKSPIIDDIWALQKSIMKCPLQAAKHSKGQIGKLTYKRNAENIRFFNALGYRSDSI